MINGIMIAVNMGSDNYIIYGQTQNFRAAFMVYGNRVFQIQINDIKVQQVRKIDQQVYWVASVIKYNP